MKNHGFIKDEIVPEDFQFGGERSIENKFGALPLQPNGDWREFIFDGIISHQAPGYETNSCVSHGTANALELLRRKLYQYDNDLSDRFIAKASGTDPLRGNTPKTVAETIRKNFTVWENEWATKDAKTVEEFYAEIPQNLKTLAIARGAEWSFGYEYVPLNLTALREALKYSPLGISVPAWFERNGNYYRPDGVNDSHWVCLMYIDEHGKMYILDSYDPAVKVMEAGFMPQVAMKYHLNRQVVNKSAFTKFLEAILAILFPKPEPVPAPVEPKKPDTVPVKESKLTLWADAHMEFEDYVPPGGKYRDGTIAPHGSASYRRKNPGNIKSVAGNFIEYATHEAGYAALCNYLIRAATNEHQAYVAKAAQLKKKSSGHLTIREYISVYAPDGPEIIENYAKYIATKCGVTPDTEIRELL